MYSSYSSGSLFALQLLIYDIALCFEYWKQFVECRIASLSRRVSVYGMVYIRSNGRYVNSSKVKLAFI